MSDNKTQEKKGFFKSLNIRKRLTLAIVALSILVFIVGGSLINYQIRKITVSHTFKELETINNIKKKEIENYFSQLVDQIIILSDYDLIVNAAQELKSAFRLLGSDGSINVSSTELENFDVDLKGYYNGTYLSILNEKANEEYSLEDVYPDEEKTILLQYLFLASNPNDFENKKLYDKPLNSGNYGSTHFKYHPKIRDLALKFGIADVYLIDSESGHVFYSLNKNPDFGTSLLSGPYRNSVLAENFKETNKATLKKHAEIDDLTFYEPNGLNPAMFISSPIFAGGKKVAVLTFCINSEEFGKILTNNFEWEEIGLGKTGEINIVGSDQLLRNNVRLYVENPQQYTKELKKEDTDNQIIESISSYGTTKLLLKKDLYDQSYKPGVDEKKSILRKYTKKRIHSVIQKLEILDLNWNIATLQKSSESLSTFRKTKLALLALSILLILSAIVIGYYYSGTLVKRIKKIRDSIFTLAKGEKFEAFSNVFEDEIGETIVALNKLNKRIDNASDFALSIGKGDFSMQFDPISENDKLGVSLNEMKSSLEKAKEEEQLRAIEEKKRNWTAEGVAIFSDLLRQNNDNINKLSLSLVGKLVEYLDASLAGIFLLDDGKNPPMLELSASYAFDRHKFLKKEIALGEGLVGTCAQEQKTIFLKEIPDDYVQITSGFGETKPNSILLIPMIVEEKVMGVIEIGSMKAFEDYQIEFVEKIGENIGSTLITTRINAQTTRLLDESRVKSEEMAAQEEEMRQNLEELKATQDEMERIKQQELDKTQGMMKSVEDNRKLLLSVLDEIPGKIFVKDANGVLLLCNSEVAAVYKKTVEELIGTSDFDNHERELAEQYRKKEIEIMEKGAETFIQEESLTGEVRYLKTTKMPFYIPYLDQTGLLGIQLDITEVKKLEIETQKQNEELREKEAELELETSMFDALLNLITDRITIKDKEGTYLRLSKTKYDALVSQGIKQPIGKSDLDIFGEEHFKRAQVVEDEVLNGKIVIEDVEKIKGPNGKLSWGATSRIRFNDKSGETRGTIAITKNVTENEDNKIQVDLLNQILENVAETLPSFMFGFDGDGTLQFFTGKAAKLLKASNKKSVFDVFSNVKKLIAEDKDQYRFDYSATINKVDWNFDVLILKNSGTENGYLGFGIEKDMANYSESMKQVIANLIKTKDSIKKLKK